MVVNNYAASDIVTCWSSSSPVTEEIGAGGIILDHLPFAKSLISFSLIGISYVAELHVFSHNSNWRQSVCIWKLRLLAVR